jgi:hypothetical protein
MARPRRLHKLTSVQAIGSIAVLGLALSVTAACPTTSFAQTSPGLPGSSQSQTQGPITTPPNQPLSAPTSGLPANILTPSTTNQLAPSTGATASFERTPSFGNAGRGLPGMPGGPPLKGPMGAQDPTADYMRPPVVGPLFCDPAVNISC